MTHSMTNLVCMLFGMSSLLPFCNCFFFLLVRWLFIGWEAAAITILSILACTLLAEDIFTYKFKLIEVGVQ